MNYKELRIGNYLQDGISKTLLLVCKLEIGIITTIVLDREKYPLADGWYNEPIPLTEEWILRMSFEDCGNYLSRGNFIFQKGHNLWQWMGVYLPQIKFVHQLQNIHFSLTGIELKTK